MLSIELYKCDAKDDECFRIRSLIMFSFFQGVMLVVVIILWVLSRLYQLRLFEGEAIYNVSDYPSFLQIYEEKQENEDDSELGLAGMKLTTEDLKLAAANAKKKNNSNDPSSSSSSSISPSCIEYLRSLFLHMYLLLEQH